MDRNGEVEEEYYVGEDGEYYYDDGEYSDEYSGDEYSDDDAEVVDVSRNGGIGKKHALKIYDQLNSTGSSITPD